MTGRFRVWDGSEMHEPPHTYLLNSAGNPCIDKRGWGHEEADVEAMHSTGLTDAEGTEVYEADIIHLWEYRSIVEWNKHASGWVLRKLDADQVTKMTRAGIADSNATVIGNRYEHPELMEEVSA